MAQTMLSLVLRTDPVTVRAVWAGFGVVASAVPTLSRVPAIEQRTRSNPEGVVSWGRFASLCLWQHLELCLKCFYSTDIWKPLEVISENWRHGQWHHFWSFAGDGVSSSFCPVIFTLRTSPECALFALCDRNASKWKLIVFLDQLMSEDRLTNPVPQSI